MGAFLGRNSGAAKTDACVKIIPVIWRARAWRTTIPEIPFEHWDVEVPSDLGRNQEKFPKGAKQTSETYNFLSRKKAEGEPESSVTW